MFNENLCRSLPLVYNNTLKHQGINAWRFVPPADVYANVSTKPENKCFCVRGPPCIGGGVFDISPCKFNVSSVLSWPHFYQADEKYLNAVTGLKPDPQKHSLFIDVNPTLGMPLSAEARIQINFITKGLPTIKPVANLPNMVFPVLWFEDVAKISILTVVFVLGSILFLFGLIALIYYLKRVRQSKVFTTKETSNGSTPITGSVGSAGSGYSNPAVSTDNPDYVGL
ncbi:Scavenger receptor class B member 1 [Armadillidium vulgare]|nr:Scavenger receptor class B member 1 [Armadillidium vulgare]